jgi:tetratricopeptide (TPR) repeat protein
MDCETIQKRRMAEAYRSGRLSPEDAEAYERHYLSCDTCFADLDLDPRVGERLRADGREFFAPEVEAERRGRLREHTMGRTGSDRSSWRWVARRPVWAGGLAAAGALLVFGLLVNENAQRTQELKGMWTPRPHPYISSELRGDAGLTEFQLGIDAYQAGRYADAVEPLRRAARLAPQEGVVKFYLGVSLLMSGRPREARRALEEAAQRTPSSRIIRWYLAQADLQTGRVRDAEQLVRDLAATSGAYMSEADSLLRRIASRTR